MSAGIFILCWIGTGVLISPLMIFLRKKFNRVRSQNLLDEIFICIRYGPLLLIPIFYQSIELTEEERKEVLRIKAEKKLKIKAEKLKIKSRFEILDL